MRKKQRTTQKNFQKWHTCCIKRDFCLSEQTQTTPLPQATPQLIARKIFEQFASRFITCIGGKAMPRARSASVALPRTQFVLDGLLCLCLFNTLPPHGGTKLNRSRNYLATASKRRVAKITKEETSGIG